MILPCHQSFNVHLCCLEPHIKEFLLKFGCRLVSCFSLPHAPEIKLCWTLSLSFIPFLGYGSRQLGWYPDHHLDEDLNLFVIIQMHLRPLSWLYLVCSWRSLQLFYLIYLEMALDTCLSISLLRQHSVNIPACQYRTFAFTFTLCIKIGSLHQLHLVEQR